MPMAEQVFVLGVDLDGVCADYTAAFAEVVADEQGLPVDELPAERSWDFARVGPRRRSAASSTCTASPCSSSRMFRDMPVIDGCAEALWRLSDAGVWIRIITHRLVVHWGHQIAVADTVAWLDDHGIPYRDLCFLGRKPEVEADLYVDDAPAQRRGAAGRRQRRARVRRALQRATSPAPGPHVGRGARRRVLARMADGRHRRAAPLPGVGDDPDRLRRLTGR